MKQRNQQINQQREEKNFFKELWWFIWEDDSLLSWIVNLILAFLIVKFVLYPGLGLALGTDFPVVAVVSDSMMHEGNFDQFWEQQGFIYSQYFITKEKFNGFIFKNGFNKGDLMVLWRPTKIKAGDVIVFRGDASAPIIHRVVSISLDGYYTTKGDHNLGSRPDETEIYFDRIYGKAVLRLPFFGWFKIGFSELLGLVGININ